MMRKYLFLYLGFLISTISSFSQDVANPFSQIVGRMNHVAVFQKTYPQEKAYLHFDNTGYFENERMYFKCYVTRSDTFCHADGGTRLFRMD